MTSIVGSTTGSMRAAAAALALVAACAGAVEASIEPVLLRWLDSRRQGEPLAAIAQSAMPPGGGRPALDERGRLVCWVAIDELARAEEWPSRLEGLQIDGRVGSFVQVYAGLEQLPALDALPGVRHIGLAPRPVPLVRSQGLEDMRVLEFWSLGGFGAGVRIGIIDVGFAGYESLLGTELPETVKARSFARDGSGNLDISGGTSHGTACAELIHDVAPEAELYLANVYSVADLVAATNWMVEEGVEVISHSLGWFAGPGDGSGPIETAVSLASRAGVLWVTAAGNFAQHHWGRTYQDADLDGVSEINDDGQEYLTIDRVESRTPFQAYLLWDRWPTSEDLDFSIELVDGDGRVLASSEDDPTQANSYLAVRSLVCACGPANDLRLVIRLEEASVDPEVLRSTHLRIFRTDMALNEDERVSSGSLAMPADSPDVLTVGAFNYAGGLEFFSSFGPNSAGVGKPEILGPDGVSTASYRGSAFSGTSAACPHVAGAVALILGSAPRGAFYHPRWSRDEILLLLRENATPVSGYHGAGSAPPAAVGWGAVRLPISPPSSAGLTDGSPLGATVEGGTLRLRLRDAPAGAEALSVFDLQGRLVARLQPAERRGNTLFYAPVEQAGLPANGRYWAREPLTRASTSFVWMGSRGGKR